MTAVNSCRCPRHAFGGLHSSANNRRDHDSSVSTRSDRRRSERNNLVVAAVAKAAIAIAHAESSQSRRMIGTSQTASRDVLRMGAWPSALLLSRRTRRIDQTVVEQTTNTRATRSAAERNSSGHENTPCRGRRQPRQAIIPAMNRPAVGASHSGNGRGAEVSGAANRSIKTALCLKRRHALGDVVTGTTIGAQ